MEFLAHWLQTKGFYVINNKIRKLSFVFEQWNQWTDAFVSNSVSLRSNAANRSITYLALKCLNKNDMRILFKTEFHFAGILSKYNYFG